MLPIIALVALLANSLNAVPVKKLDAISNGYDDVARSGLDGTIVPLDKDTWSYFYFTDPYEQSAPIFSISTNLTNDGDILITDLYCKGDKFLMLSENYDQGVAYLWGSTDPDTVTCSQNTTDPDTAPANGWAYVSLPLFDEGTTYVQIWGWESPFAGGRGAIQWRSTTKGRFQGQMARRM